MTTYEDLEEIKRRIKRIQEVLEEEQICTAAWMIKRLAVDLDRKNYAESLKVLMAQ